MDHKTRVKNHRWPRFILDNDQPALVAVLYWTLPIYILILSIISRFTNFQNTVVPAKQPMVLVYEQTYIDTSEAKKDSAPKHTKYYGAHDQVASQEHAPNHIDNGDPTIKGNVPSQTIVATERSDIAINENNTESSKNTKPTGYPEYPLDDFLHKAVPNNDGEGISQIEPDERANQHIALNRKKNRKLVENSIKQQIDLHKNEHAHIRSVRSIPSPLRRSESSVLRLGKISMDVIGSEFGEYEQRLLEAISYRWQLLSQRLTNSGFAGEVVINYTINKDGTITDVAIKKCTTSYDTALICSDSVASQSPLPEWSEDMIKKFGNNKQMVVKFIYY